MWVNPFWMGVLVTIVAEIAVVLVCAVIAAGRSDKK